jgi:hypothetical protein
MIHCNQLHQRIYHSIQKKKFNRRVNKNSTFQKDNNKIISQTNMEFFPVISVSDSLLYSPEPPTQSTIIVKNDMGNIINEIDNLKKKIKH